MARQILIDPVTRLEGHAKITLHLDDQGDVEAAHFHITQLRGFEKFCEGRRFFEMPYLMSRICGICPVSHLIASAKACDAILAVSIPETAANLRRVMNLAQVIQSHALSFFYLSAPDLLLGMESDPARRNLFGVAEAHPGLARDGVGLRQFGQQIIESLGGRRIHPGWVVPGGVAEPLTAERRDRILGAIPEALNRVQRTLDWFKRTIESFREEIRTFANFPSMFLGLVGPEGELETYDGNLRLADEGGNLVQDQLDPQRYAEFIGEVSEPWTYMKFPYYKPAGREHGFYRVGPLARLNIISRCGTNRADQELAEFRELGRGPILSSFHYHYARLIEILHSIELTEELLGDAGILSKDVRAVAEPNRREGIGVAEAPRGTLFHHYKIDDEGLITWANLIIATGHNNMAMNRGILQAARHYVSGEQVSEGMLNRVEAVIRTFDPCLSCSTHAVGQMPMVIQLVARDGRLVRELRRDG
ncbi:MAG TPA: Ni/Fe hydrogenase subunit alpha [Terriglobia bacterium]|jgi:NAD-reducing hydrogenase large subunit|nr:Ni/Fe hydrogenase subunit alpha [Terriglobia bacterium]